MNLQGAIVRHATFGEGTILDRTDHYLFVSFAGAKKEFLYPSAFCKYITAVDPGIAEYIQGEVATYQASEAAILESSRQQRMAVQNARKDALQNAAATAKPRKRKTAKAGSQVSEEAKP